MDARAPRPAQEPQRIRLSLSCQHLTNADIGLNKTDAQVTVLISDPSTRGQGQNGWVTLGRTEIVQNSLNPEFATSIEVLFRFEWTQQLRFLVNDVDKHHHHNGTTTFSEKLVGEAACTVGDLVFATNGRRTWNLTHGRGHISVLTEPILPNEVIVTMQLAAHDLPRVDMFGPGADPYFVISRVRADTGAHVAAVLKSDVVKGSRTPAWQPVSISSSKLGPFAGEKLVLAVWDWDKASEHDLIGETDLPPVLTPNVAGEFQLFKKGHHRGKVVIQWITNTQPPPPPPSFVQYLSHGVQISLMVAIDFTASNMQPQNPSSLHYLHPGSTQLNQYERSILSVGSVLQPYDTDGMIPAWAFGLHLDNFGTTHCHPLSNDANVLELRGIQGVFDAYHALIQHVQLSGPTKFAPIFNVARQMAIASDMAALQAGKPGNYSILMVVTDGDIEDMAETRRMVSQISQAPLSIVIVGVGRSGFRTMHMLDEEVPQGGRDCVEFVEFIRAEHEPHLLAERTLSQIPGQFTEFFRRANRVLRI